MKMRAFIVVLLVTAVLAKNIKEPIKKRFFGQDHTQNRIVGGVAAKEGEAKYQVSLQESGNHICGGAILNNKWVITAAHCVEDYVSEPSRLSVISGTHQYNQGGQQHNPIEIYVHCNYNVIEFMNDIALIRLDLPITFNNNTAPIELPDEPLQAGDPLVLTGWGTTELYGDPPDSLQTLTVNFVPYDECKAAMVDYPGVGPYHICTFTREGQGACHGDSGGPLVHDGKLYGVVNWGVPCAKGHPDMQANVYYYHDWIRTTIDGCKS